MNQKILFSGGHWMTAIVIMSLMVSVSLGTVPNIAEAMGTVPKSLKPIPPASVELSVEDAVRMALANNPALTIAIADREAAKGGLTAARAGFWPTITATHSDSDSWYNPGSTTNSSATAARGLDRFIADNYVTVSWTLYSGGKVHGLASQAQATLDSATWGVTRARQTLKLSATTAYYGLVQAKKLLEVNQEAVSQLEQHLKDVQLQFEVGTVAKVDVLRSEVDLANAGQNLIKAQNSYDVAMATLNNVIGLPLTTTLKTKEALPYERFITPLAECIETGVKQRPESMQGIANIKSADAGVVVARSGYLPSVAAAYKVDWNDTNFPGASSTNQNWLIALTANWTVMDSGLTAGNLKKAMEGLNKARAQLAQTLDSIRLEVQASYLNMREAEKRIETAGVAVEKAEEDFKIAQIRYSAGVGTNLDVIDAHTALTQAKTNFVQAQTDYNTSKAKLEASMGIPVN